ncbi:MAG: hypothetical protein PSU94_06690, partial [Lacunisphaera sp.]|nr:hypothetical protein [Lacunisphaera sp.]
AVNGQGRTEQAFALRQENVRRFPRDPLVYYDLALAQRAARDFDGSLKNIDAALALEPFASALLMKTLLLASWQGDLNGARAALEQVSSVERTEDRAVGMAMWLGLLERQPQRVLDAGALTARPYFEDTIVRGAKAYSLALAYQLDGKAAFARTQWEAAEAVLRARVQDPAAIPSDRALWATALAGLGRTDDAVREFAPFEAIIRELPENQALATGAYNYAAQYYATLGDAVQAVPYLRREINGPTAFVSDYTLPVDPRWDKLRGTPEFAALLAESKARLASKTATVTVPAPAPLSPARELAEKARTLVQGLEATREDFALAEDYCQRALKLDSSDGEVWAAYSILHGAYGYRGWDTSPERREQIRVTAERAIRLAPTSAEARLAQAGAWTAFGLNRAEVEKILREVLQERPTDQATLRFLAVTVLGRGDLAECLALNERAAALPGGDPLALFNNARYLWQRGRRDEAYAMLNRAIAQRPFNSALVLKTSMELIWRGDMAAAEATFRQIPQSMLLEDRANFTAGQLYYYQRQPEAALAAWGSFPRDSYSDFAYDGPKGLLIGLADELDHRDAAARIEWRTALQVVEKRIAATPNTPSPYYYKAYLLACLGEKAAAEDVLRTYEQLAGIKYTPESPMTFELGLVYLRLGRFDDFFAHAPNSIRRMRIDPRLDGLRTDPRYVRLMAEFLAREAEGKK